MNKILIGTGNQAKIAAYKKLLKDYNLEVVTSKDLNISEPEEVGETFEKTAADKAKYYFEKSRIPTIVDDGGFEIDALHGEPGVKSKRWIGREMTDEEIVQEVMKRMQSVENRSAKHTVVLALATPYGIFLADSSLDGVVAQKAHEKILPGFPYRSVLYFPNYKKYWIDLNPKEEEILNHRRVALEKIKDVIKELEKN